MAWEPSLSPVALSMWGIFGMGNLGLQQHTIKMEKLHTRLLMGNHYDKNKSEGFSLAKWVIEQRIHSKSLSKDKIDRLNDIYFQWVVD